MNYLNNPSTACTTPPQGLSLDTQLSHNDILSLNTYDFLAYLGKTTINPGGVEGRKQLLNHLNIKPNTHLLEIGCGTGHTACYIAKKYNCKVTAIDISEAMVDEARLTIKKAGLEDRVQCKTGDIMELEYEDNHFDYVMSQAVLMFVDQKKSLSEIIRVLKPGGSYAGLEFAWHKQPSLDMERETNQICGCVSLKFHLISDWKKSLTDSNFIHTKTVIKKLKMLSIIGFIQDEGIINTVKISLKLCLKTENRIRMKIIWAHFSNHLDYIGYGLLTGEKPS